MGAEDGTQIPRMAQFEVLTWCKEMVLLLCWIAVIQFESHKYALCNIPMCFKILWKDNFSMERQNKVSIGEEEPYRQDRRGKTLCVRFLAFWEALCILQEHSVQISWGDFQSRALKALNN
jgi:hypothetical protein